MKKLKIKPKSLAESWLLAESNHYGLSRAKAVRVLNAMTGGTYTTWRIGEWVNGRRQVPASVRRHMLRRCLPFVMEQYGIEIPLPDAEIENVVRSLS